MCLMGYISVELKSVEDVKPHMITILYVVDLLGLFPVLLAKKTFFQYPDMIRCDRNLGSGTLSGKMLLVRIVENNRIIGQVRLSKG